MPETNLMAVNAKVVKIFPSGPKGPAKTLKLTKDTVGNCRQKETDIISY